jgi:hypothetical protein
MSTCSFCICYIVRAWCWLLIVVYIFVLLMLYFVYFLCSIFDCNIRSLCDVRCSLFGCQSNMCCLFVCLLNCLNLFCYFVSIVCICCSNLPWTQRFTNIQTIQYIYVYRTCAKQHPNQTNQRQIQTKHRKQKTQYIHDTQQKNNNKTHIHMDYNIKNILKQNIFINVQYRT